MPLPIELIPGTRPPRFRWCQTISTLAGNRIISHEGTISTSLEDAVAELIELAQKQTDQIAILKQQVADLLQLTGTQAEQLAKQAENPSPAPVQDESLQPAKPHAPTSSKRNRGTG